MIYRKFLRNVQCSLKGHAELKLIRDFMDILVTCKYEEDLIKKKKKKNEVTIDQTTFSPL